MTKLVKKPYPVDEQISALERQIADLRRKREEERTALRNRTVPRQQFLLICRTEQHRAHGWQVILDPRVQVWRLEKRVLNHDECVAAGCRSDSLNIGGMNYLFNQATGRIVCSTGGGFTYVRAERGFRGDPPEVDALSALERAISLSNSEAVPEGEQQVVDVTDIIRDLTDYGRNHMQETQS